MAATLDEAPAVKGRASYGIRFRFDTQRNCPRDPHFGGIALRTLSLTFDDGRFNLMDTASETERIYYSAAERDGSPTYSIRLKNLVVDVDKPREIFDPATQQIYLLVPTSAKDLEELLNVQGRSVQ